MSAQYLDHIHPPTPFLPLLSPPTGTNPPDRTCSALLFSDFVEEKNDIFVYLRWLHREFPCDISIYIYTHTHIYYNQIGSSPLFFFFSALVACLWWFQQA
jgi:hypothetical protein